LGKGGSGAAGRPRTLTGRWLVAVVLRRYDLRDRLVAEFQLSGSRNAELAVLEEAARLALHEHFGDSYDVPSVNAFAAAIQDSWSVPSGIGLMELEAVVRAALGETDVDLTGIAAPVRGDAHFFSVLLAARLNRWDPRTLNDLVSRAEAAVFGRGLKPQLAQSHR